MMPLAIAANAIVDRAAAAMAARKAADAQNTDPVVIDGDPLLALLRQYRAGVTAFDAGPQDDLHGTIAAATYEPFLSALEMPPAPTTLKGAMAGLDFVREELAQFSPSPACRAVLAVAMDFMRKPGLAPIGRERATYYIRAHTDIIGGTAYNVEYARECLLCEPIQDLTDGLVVMALTGWHPHLVRMQRNGRDADGGFVKPGSEKEAIDLGFFRCRPESIGKDVLLLGRLVDQTRRFPKGDV